MNNDWIAHARSLLFVPGNRPERFEKALRSGADAVVLDLEDSVPAAEKGTACEAIAGAWARFQAIGLPTVVRINVTDGQAIESELAWLDRLPGLAAVMLPKAEAVDAISLVHRRCKLPVLPLIESAAGHAALPSLGSAPGVLRLVIGHIDFVADTGLQCDDEESELAPLRFAVAMATRLSKLAPAIDGVTVQIGDEEKLRRDTRRAVRFGFGGKLCIHPSQVAGIHEALAPTAQELVWARKVVDADASSGGAAVQVDGRMVDVPVVMQARRTLARAAAGHS